MGQRESKGDLLVAPEGDLGDPCLAMAAASRRPRRALRLAAPRAVGRGVYQLGGHVRKAKHP